MTGYETMLFCHSDNNLVTYERMCGFYFNNLLRVKFWICKLLFYCKFVWKYTQGEFCKILYASKITTNHHQYININNMGIVCCLIEVYSDIYFACLGIDFFYPEDFTVSNRLFWELYSKVSSWTPYILCSEHESQNLRSDEKLSFKM